MFEACVRRKSGVVDSVNTSINSKTKHGIRQNTAKKKPFRNEKPKVTCHEIGHSKSMRNQIPRRMVLLRASETL